MFTVLLPSINVQNDPCNTSEGFENDFEDSLKSYIIHLGAEVTNINIWASLSFSHNVFDFS